MEQPAEIRFYPNEEWKVVTFEHPRKLKYAISNFGRLVSYSNEIKNGYLVKGNTIEGYKNFSYKVMVGKKRLHKQFFFHKLVAIYFIHKPSEEHKFVMHIDRNKTNNHVDNLKWVTQKEMTEHNLKNPKYIEAQRKAILTKRNGKCYKLNSTTVKLIKKKITDPNRKTRMRLIAKQFGISEMQLYRIKSGENWGHVTI
jgi:DNA primase catalytic subunit